VIFSYLILNILHHICILHTFVCYTIHEFVKKYNTWHTCNINDFVYLNKINKIKQIIEYTWYKRTKEMSISNFIILILRKLNIYNLAKNLRFFYLSTLYSEACTYDLMRSETHIKVSISVFNDDWINKEWKRMISWKKCYCNIYSRAYDFLDMPISMTRMLSLSDLLDCWSLS